MFTKQLSFRYVYTQFPCFFKRNLPAFIFDGEKSARDGATEYENPSVEFVTIQKVGIFKYLVVWRVQGYLKED